MKAAILLPLAALLSGCCTPPAPEVRVIDTACTWTVPIYVSRADVLTDDTAESILAHNETGRDRCGWVPPKKKGAVK